MRKLKSFVLKGFVSQRTRIVTAPADGFCTNPIFIVGAHRSGTSLVRRIIDSHPRIACPPESFWLKHYSQMLEDERVFEGLWGLGFDRAEVIAGLATGARYFHELYCRAKGKPRWADKTPDYAFHLDTLRTLFGDETRFVLVVRYPPDVAYSLWQRGWRFDGYGEEPIANACEYVADSLAHQLDFLARRPNAGYKLHYDRLVREPNDTLHALCDFLGEPWDDNMLAFNRQRHDVGIEDPVVRGTRGFEGSFDNWRMWSEGDRERALQILALPMKRLGYTAESPFLGR
jgi:hypothetical protein